jgi:hypothetical protein
MLDTLRHTTGHGTASGGFAELVYADPDWLRAEFDAIVAANFGTPPPRRRPPSRPGSSGPATAPVAAHPLTEPTPPREAAPSAHGWRRQRSPPVRARVPPR